MSYEQPPKPPKQPTIAIGTSTLVKVVAAGAALYYGLKEHKRRRRSEQSRGALDVEDGVVEYLYRCGAIYAYATPGSRGPYDVYAKWSRVAWCIQVKSSRKSSAKWPGPAERDRLFAEARRKRARAVVALNEYGKTTYYDATTRERVYPPRE